MRNYLAAKSLWTTCLDSRYFMPDAIWVAMYIKLPVLKNMKNVNLASFKSIT